MELCKNHSFVKDTMFNQTGGTSVTDGRLLNTLPQLFSEVSLCTYAKMIRDSGLGFSRVLNPRKTGGPETAPPP